MDRGGGTRKPTHAQCKDCASTSNLQSPRITNWGTWGNLEECEDGTFVTAMRLKIQEYQGIDDSAFQDVLLFCGARGDTDPRNWKKLPATPYGDRWGWEPLKGCTDGEVAHGFELQSEVEQAEDPNDPGIIDNAGAIGLRLICSGGKREVIEDEGPFPWGKWTGPKMCPKQQHICAFRAQIEPHRDSGKSYYLNTPLTDSCVIENMVQKRIYK